ncbi:MAG: zinc-ribbon domain-containing protein, partial [Chloroflexi bacterium]|nr:zinc-ribbon domain-containing protein [Chloroflexota bacterium]
MRVQNIVLCPRCQAQNPPGQQICCRCGARWCTRCHAILPDKSRFCPTCGFLF